ncbi:DUF5610 domain-containing protein [Colwellia sp. 1_MG-2023]|uniref:DUF5610 domain-containing protein n=1 Tax=Colwellia sp. 1_MG-2023 TaxID=3062649 RepID=UPI0026E1A598|nr:DUF5610 domain-containing protein [Colwellia sp. 1_MG-2023]MDO6445212.1 DUF5610 domain-containing protein [Colwellia sp. 1_MG-2023]
MMNKVDNVVESKIPHRNHVHKSHEQQRSNPLEAYRQEILDNVALTGNGKLAMKVVQHSISLQFSSNSRQVITDEDVEEIEEKNKSLFDFTKVAENVLNFIGGRIRLAKEEGSSDEELGNMFAQARSGVTQGFEQAMGELEELAVLDDELTDGIDKSRDLIFQGIDDLEQSYFPGENTTTESDDNALNNKNSVSSMTTELYAASSRTSDIMITTLDGDKVSISFSDIQQVAQNEKYLRDNEQGEMFASSNSAYRASNFSYTIEGDISEDEQKAIAELIKDVNALQKDFFKGDIEKAFNHAVNLGFDTSQISEFSMELYQSKTTRVTQTYNEVANSEPGESPSQDKALRPLLDFVKQLQLLQHQSDSLLEKQDKQFANLFKQIFSAENSGRDDFFENMKKLDNVTKHFIQ